MSQYYLPLKKLLIVLLFPLLLFLNSCAAHADNLVKTGGLVSYPVPVISENLLKNPGFEEIDPASKLPIGWKASKAFSLDTSNYRSGGRSMRLRDAPFFPWAESLKQEVFLRKGAYRISGWVKMDNIEAKNKGVRLGIAGYNTPLLNGTSDWQKVSVEKISITKDGNYGLSFHAYNEPAGTAWLDDVELRREGIPVEAFLLYPNYRGILFDDQSQTIKVHVSVDPPDGTGYADYRVENTIIDERNNDFVLGASRKAEAEFLQNLNGSKLAAGHTYLLKTRLLRNKDNALVYEYPPYRIVKVSGTLRKKMTVAFDEYNRFLVRGKPTFLLGVYDAGMGYFAAEWQWEKALMDNRRLFELPINIYNNYWYGIASLESMQALMNVLQRHGVLYLQTGNCFGGGYDGRYFRIDTDDGFLKGISTHPGLAGFYTADECISGLAPRMFEQYQRLKKFKPDGVTFSAFSNPSSLSYWRDTVDVLSTDPYPLVRLEPLNGYPLHMVADWTRATREAVKGSRPFMTVLQFFLFTSNSRWPKREELRNMSYMAIVEGANGLLYWSIGTRALGSVCKDWCKERIGHFEDLKAVMNELKNLEPILGSIDQPSLLIDNSNTAAVRTRVKLSNGKGYLIAYNYTNKTAAATFTWSSALAKVTVRNEGRTLQITDSRFTDTFGPYQPHVYEIETR
jgi:hypothetical protein